MDILATAFCVFFMLLPMVFFISLPIIGTVVLLITYYIEHKNKTKK